MVLFVAGLTTPVILDKVQHVPELFPVIDRNRQSGLFLLTEFSECDASALSYRSPSQGVCAAWYCIPTHKLFAFPVPCKVFLSAGFGPE
jgi:hypothetical protein